jgi:hypothetical protein
MITRSLRLSLALPSAWPHISVTYIVSFRLHYGVTTTSESSTVYREHSATSFHLPHHRLKSRFCQRMPRPHCGVVTNYTDFSLMADASFFHFHHCELKPRFARRVRLHCRVITEIRATSICRLSLSVSTKETRTPANHRPHVSSNHKTHRLYITTYSHDAKTYTLLGNCYKLLRHQQLPLEPVNCHRLRSKLRSRISYPHVFCGVVTKLRTFRPKHTPPQLTIMSQVPLPHVPALTAAR